MTRVPAARREQGLGEADAIPVGVVRLDGRRRIVDANEWFTKWTGRSPAELAGRSIDEFLTHADGDLFPANTGPGPWMMLDPRRPHRAVMVARDSEVDEEVLVLTEASERWRALSDLRRRHALADRTRNRLELIMDSSVAFSTATTEERLAEVLANAAARAYRAEEASVYLHRPDGTSGLAAGREPLGGGVDADSIITLVSAPRRVVKVVGAEEGERLLPGLGASMQLAGVGALIAAPLHHEETDFGAFAAWFHHDRTFDEEAAPLAEALAGQAAQALATLRLQTRLAHAATYDEVTGLPNRRLLEAELDAVVGRTGCAVLFIDLDGFKEVNDRLGHQFGDRVLRDAGHRLLAAVRTDDLVARYGGDEFVIVCETDDPSVATDIAQRALDRLHGDGESGRRLFGASIGVAVAPAGSPLSAEQLIRNADLAMYRAKTAGGNRIALAGDGSTVGVHSGA
ncbi:diguanylate cyclase domain-containing protein [Microbacterium sp. NPDC057407]|uniref:sensor domain-containing protein n=1 Tax=Microbacterium sp. NPDC057407 TaxID=3346120 RepID=UPI003670BED5